MNTIPSISFDSPIAHHTSFTYLGHEVHFYVCHAFDDEWHAYPEIYCDGTDDEHCVQIYFESPQEHITDALYDAAAFTNDFTSPEFKAALAAVLDLHLASKVVQ